jgi:hypothetical protein
VHTLVSHDRSQRVGPVVLQMVGFSTVLPWFNSPLLSSSSTPGTTVKAGHTCRTSGTPGPGLHLTPRACGGGSDTHSRSQVVGKGWLIPKRRSPHLHPGTLQTPSLEYSRTHRHAHPLPCWPGTWDKLASDL